MATLSKRCAVVGTSVARSHRTIGENSKDNDHDDDDHDDYNYHLLYKFLLAITSKATLRLLQLDKYDDANNVPNK